MGARKPRLGTGQPRPGTTPSGEANTENHTEGRRARQEAPKVAPNSREKKESASESTIQTPQDHHRGREKAESTSRHQEEDSRGGNSKGGEPRKGGSSTTPRCLQPEPPKARQQPKT